MIPVFFFLLILSVTDVPLSEAVDDEAPAGQCMNLIPTPEDEIKTPELQDDIALPDVSSRNADPCTARGCKWPKTGHYVYVPYYISTNYTSSERKIIMKGLMSFHEYTCIRFVRWRQYHCNYLYFVSKTGCWSYIGFQKGEQYISLGKDGCVHHSTVQHEVLHALGFNHEQVRSDRDKYVRILFQNIKPGKEHNFRKKQTNNLKTPYDFNSVMQYSKYAFSRNGKPTIVAKSDPNLDFGHAKEMSINDITRVNRLYNCCSEEKPC